MMNVTEEQYERAARRVCQLRRIDPDAMGWDGNFDFRPNVVQVQEELSKVVMLLTALDEVLTEDETEQEAILDQNVDRQ